MSQSNGSFTNGVVKIIPGAKVSASELLSELPPVHHTALGGGEEFPGTLDLVCLSHLRWDFVYQRPQHLLSRCARDRRVFFVEEPVLGFVDSWWLEVSQRECGVWVVVPHLPDWVNEELVIAMQQNLLNALFKEYEITAPILWYYTPIALQFTYSVKSSAVVYDCMDEPL